jgi:hypothetical protein
MALAVGACEFGPATPEPLPTGDQPTPTLVGGPAISIDQQWQIVDDIWTFTGFVDPRGGTATVVLEVGYDVANRFDFEDEVPVASNVTERGAIEAHLPTPDRDWLCVRFKATTEGGDGVTQPFCFPTDLPTRTGNVVFSPAPSASPSPS